MGHGQISEGDFIQFSAHEVNRPDKKRAALVYEDLCRYLPHPNLKAATPKMISRVYRESIYEQAMSPAVI